MKSFKSFVPPSLPSPPPIWWTSNDTAKDVYSFHCVVLNLYIVSVYEHITLKITSTIERW